MSATTTKVVSDPYEELSVKNAKYAKNCSELYLSGKSIEELGRFEQFVSLETLWLNNNKLRRVSNLDGNFRIKYLYVQNNRLVSLAGSIKNFKFLHTLMLGNNKLSNLARCLGVLSRLTHIKQLDLSKNPVTQEENYRLRVIFAMPGLQVLDCKNVKEEERQRATLKFGRKGRAAEEQLARLEAAAGVGPQMPQRSPEDLVGPLSGAAALLMKDLDDIYTRREKEERGKVELARRELEEPGALLKRTESETRLLPKPSFWKGKPCHASGAEIQDSALANLRIASVGSNNNREEERAERWKHQVKSLSSVRNLEHRHDRFMRQCIVQGQPKRPESVAGLLSKSHEKKYALFGNRFKNFQQTQAAQETKTKIQLFDTVF